MSTSLAEQLQRLAVPQTSVLKRDKKRPSLLFDPKEAATLTRETVYQIGLEGYEELRNRNPSFYEFENTLFNVTSKQFERSVQTADANEKLDKNIRKFLLLLSPYFLLNSAHKALEWLINRFSIHEYNRNEFIMLMLPYHDTNIFVRALQLVHIKESNDSWLWLRSLQKPGIRLSKQTLYNHAASDPQFLKLVSNYIIDAVTTHENPYVLTVLFNFYSLTFVGALEHSENINEAQVSQMLSAVLKGTASNVTDFCAGSYIIVAKLLSKTELSDRLLSKFVDNITQFQITNLKTEAALLLIILYQTQKQFKVLSPKAVKNLTQKPWIPKLLQELNAANTFIIPFLETLFRETVKSALLEVAANNCKKFLTILLNEVKLDNEFVPNLINIIVDAYKPNKESYIEEAEQWIKEFVRSIETQYPAAFDKEVNQIMKMKPGKNLTKRQKSFQRILNSNAGLVDKISVFEKLYHPVPSIRQGTLKLIIAQYKDLEERDREFFRNAILDKLNDENCDVVCETLIHSKEITADLLDENVFVSILTKLLIKAQRNKDEWWRVSHPALKILCALTEGNNVGTFLRLLPFLLPTDDKELEAAKIIVNSSYVRKCDFLLSFENRLRKAKSCGQFFAIVFDGLSTNSNKFDFERLVNALKDISDDDRDTVHKYLASLLLCSSLHQNCSVEMSSSVLNVLLTYLNLSTLEMVKTEPSGSSYISCARKGKFPMQGFLHCIETLILKTCQSEVRIGLHDFSQNNNTSKFFSILLDILLKGCFANQRSTSLLYAGTLKTYFKHFCVDFKTRIEYCLNIAVAYSDFISSPLQLRSIHSVNSLLNMKQESITSFVNLDEIIIPYILICLTNPYKEIRSSAIETVQVILSIVGANTDNTYTLLLRNLLQYKEEIIMDEEQVSVIISNILSPKAKDKKSDVGLKKILNALIDIAFEEEHPDYLKAGILKILSHINDFEIYNKMSVLAADVITREKDSSKEFDTQKSAIIYNILSKFDADAALNVHLNTNIYNLLEISLRSDSCTLKLNFGHQSNLSLLALTQITQGVFENLNVDVKDAVLNTVIEVASTTSNFDVLSAAGHVFKHIDLDADLVVKQLTRMRDVQSPKLSVSKRKRRVSIIPTLDILDTSEWKKGVTILEFVQSKKKIRNASVLLPILFDILKRCLDFDEQANVEYTKQLLLSGILNLCDKLEGDNFSENVFNMESIVQCIRASQNPQTHHHALLVLAHTSHLIPRQVLHHVMAIFTFMGSSVLRHDDAYSFQIIKKIMDTIIPILLTGKTDNVVNVLRVFVDAVLDVPEHRRIPLYRSLLEQIDAKQNMCIFLLLMSEAHVFHANTEKQKNKGQLSTPKRLDIAANLAREFPADVVILSCIKLIEYLRNLPEDKQEFMETDSSQLIDIAHHTPKQFRHYKYVLVTFIVKLLSSNEFVTHIAALTDDKLVELEPLFKNMIIGILIYVQSVVKISEKNVRTPQAQYWKVMLHHSYDILDSANALLTPQMFLLVIRGLTTHHLNAIRRRSLELLNSKLQYSSSFFDICEESELYAMIPPLINIIKQIESGEIDAEQELIVQTALLSLKLFVKRLAKSGPEKFVQILEFITNLVKSGKVQGNILASTILCLAELCSNLRALAISSLSKIMPFIIRLLKIHKREEVPDLLLLSCITAIQKIVDSLPLFLSPYLEKLLCELSSIAAKWNLQQENPKLTPLLSKIVSIRQKIGSTIPARILIPIIDDSYKNLARKNKFSSIGPLMDILTENLSNLKGAEIQANLPDLTTFFLNALQFRAEGCTSTEEINQVESHVIKALVTLILKLSESTFRPLYYKIYDWAVRSGVKSERVITFYSLSSEVASSLKGLFVLFAGNFLNNAAALLDECNSIKHKKMYFVEEEKTVVLIENIFKTLSTVCLYGSQKFITKERFDVLMQPMIDQLENTLDGMESLVHRAETLVIPCIVQFSVATGDDALWKQLNYQVLLKTRHTSPSIRLIALRCLGEVAKKLGEDFLPLLPEIIPFLAELLEDDEESVEKACQKTVQELEKVLGEPLQKYF